MGQRTITLNATKWAYVAIGSPDTHYTVTDSGEYPVGDEAKILVGLEAFDETIKRNRILGMTVTAQAFVNYLSENPTIHVLNGDFDPSTVTYNTSPRWDNYGIGAYTLSGTYGEWQDYTRSETVDYVLTSTNLTDMQKMVQYGRYAVGGTAGVKAKIKTKSGSTAMFSVTYDPDVVLHGSPYPTRYPTGTVDPRQATVFEWEMRKSSSYMYCMDEEFHQVSGKFYWKLSGDNNWTVIDLGEDECTVTIAANTFPTADAVTWYVETVDEDGVTATSRQYSFNTPTNNLYFSDRPIGSNVDIRNPILFKWILGSAIGDYDQQSATLYWKKEGDEEWNTITTGSEKEILVPALTFPTYATILWYLEATDTGGHTVTYEESTFSTPTVRIKLLSYPEGDNINTQKAQYFSWVYSNTVFTDYTQSSAVFCWRQLYADEWNTIQISGNVKSISVAANTFPTDKTIQWFVEGTDIGGTSSNTGIKKFNTVTTQIVPQNCPTGGYQDPRYDITFSWFYSSEIGDYTQSSAVLYWRETGDEEWTEINVSGDVKSVVVAANTFPVASEIEWYIAGTDSGGSTTTTSQYSFSTAATTAYALCVSPVGQVEDGTKPITFSWIVKNDDGSLPLRTVIEWKYDTESQLEWKTLLDTVNTDTEYTVPSETFHAGAVEWRISAYNRDLVEGPVNNASFVCLMSPSAPVGLAATPVPRTTIRWQAPGQEAYEITIDGKVVIQEYGPSVYSYQVNEPLEDGEHSIQVRVQGQYGLWSNYSETAIKVENDPSNTVTLSGVFGIDADLLWSLATEDLNSSANVYRDGVRIASVGNELNFTDKMAIGEHSYYVELWEDDGNYSRSNTVTGTMTTDTVVISEIDGAWMELKYSETSDRDIHFQWSRNHSLKYVCGAEYPIIEVGKHSTMTGNYACAFNDLDEAKAFESLKGKVVVIKSGKSNMMVGALVTMSKKVTQFYIAYSFALDQIDWEDFTSHET